MPRHLRTPGYSLAPCGAFPGSNAGTGEVCPRCLKYRLEKRWDGKSGNTGIASTSANALSVDATTPTASASTDAGPSRLLPDTSSSREAATAVAFESERETRRPPETSDAAEAGEREETPGESKTQGVHGRDEVGAEPVVRMLRDEALDRGPRTVAEVGAGLGRGRGERGATLFDVPQASA